MIFGRRGCDPRLVARYRRIATIDFVVGLGIPVFLAGLKTGVGVLPLAVFSLMIGVPGGAAVGKWLVPTEGLRSGPE
jgi:hypothetical protein